MTEKYPPWGNYMVDNYRIVLRATHPQIVSKTNDEIYKKLKECEGLDTTATTAYIVDWLTQKKELVS